MAGVDHNTIASILGRVEFFPHNDGSIQIVFVRAGSFGSPVKAHIFIGTGDLQAFMEGLGLPLLEQQLRTFFEEKYIGGLVAKIPSDVYHSVFGSRTAN